MILSAGFGEGHNSAAKNLAKSIEEESHGAVCPVVIDPFSAASPRLSAFMRWGYQFMTNRIPWLWRWMYENTQQGNFGNHIWDWCVGLMPWLENELARRKPEIVVMTYPLYAYFIPGLNVAVPRPRRLFMAVTDSISIHPIWTHAQVDRWFVTDELSREVVIGQGVDAKRCEVTGFAVDPCYESLPIRQSGGGCEVLWFATTGTRHVRATMAGLLTDLPLNVGLTIVTGRHEARLRPLLERMLRLVPRSGVTIHGWTGDVPGLMARSLVILTKAGGATTHECFAAGVPAVINYIIPGQEEGNAELLERTGCGCRSEDPGQTGALLRELITGDGLTQMTAAMQQHRRPDGASRMARIILASLNQGGA